MYTQILLPLILLKTQLKQTEMRKKQRNSNDLFPPSNRKRGQKKSATAQPILMDVQ